MFDLRMPVRYNTFTSKLLWLLWGLHQSNVCVVVRYPGHVLDVAGKQKECQSTRVLAGFCVIYAVTVSHLEGIFNDWMSCMLQVCYS